MIAVEQNGIDVGAGPAKLRVLYVMPNTTRLAGIEAVVHDVASELARRYGDRLDVHVLITSDILGLQALEVPYVPIRQKARGRWDLLRIFRAVAAQGAYDLTVVPQVEATVLFALACLSAVPRLILYLHGNTDREQSHWKAKALFWLLRAAVLQRLVAVFGVSPTQLEAFRSRFRGRCPHVWVPNPVQRFTAAEARRPYERSPAVTFVNVARFAYQKGHDLLIAAFAEVHRARPRSRLVLVGYGALEGQVREAITRDRLDDAVRLETTLTNPEPELARADVYVSTSRWEGWGVAICEALRFGLPVVATDCPFGPGDILADERLGRLVPLDRPDQLVDTMLHYCDNLGQEARHAAFRQAYVDRFSLDHVVHRHAEALLGLAAREAPSAVSPPASAS